MLEELSLLIRLQELDNELMDLEAEKGDLPDQLSRLKQEINRYTSELVTAKEDLTKINISKQEQNGLVEEAKEQLKKSQSTLFNVKTTREYDAISAEIEQAKTRISEAEKQILEMMSREESIEIFVNDKNGKLSLIQKEYNEKEADMRERFESSQEEEDELLKERSKIVKKLKDPVYAHYERIRKIRDGVGVSHLDNSACSYCFSMVPPQRQVEIRRSDDLILCETCGCILVYKNNT